MKSYMRTAVHVAVRLFLDRSQMISNAVKTKKLVRIGTRPAGEGVTDVFTEQSHGNIESI